MNVLTQKEQFLILERNWERVLDELRDDLGRRDFRERLHALAVVRLMENYQKYGSAMYNWESAVRRENMDEEIADFINYGSSEP